MKRWFAALALACIAIGSGLSGAQPAGTSPTTSRFDHAKHEIEVTKLKKKLDCKGCHGLDNSGKIVQPGAQGHFPCMQSGCHSDLFLASGKTREGKPEEFKKKQTAVCTVCHNEVPPPWKKAPVKVLKVFESQVDHHVEMNHFNHVTGAMIEGKVVECRQCHVVNPKGTDSRFGTEYGLKYNAPGHSECVLCHNPKQKATHTMEDCGVCHKDGSRVKYNDGASRPSGKKVVRACDSEGLKLLKQAIEIGDVKLSKPGGEVKAHCFKHETKAHRFKDRQAADPKDPVQCKACHHIVELDKTFESLRDMKSKSVIDRNEEAQHKRCWASGCHDRAPLDSCGFCHADVSGF